MLNGVERIANTSERIKEAMRDANKKQIDLVRDTGIDKGSMSHYVSGRYEPKQEAIYKLAIALNVSEMWLWGYNVPKERSLAQKNNDIIADIIVRLRTDMDYLSVVDALRTDAEFLAAIQCLHALDSEKRKSVMDMLKAFAQ